MAQLVFMPILGSGEALGQLRIVGRQLCCAPGASCWATGLGKARGGLNVQEAHVIPSWALHSYRAICAVCVSAGCCTAVMLLV